MPPIDNENVYAPNNTGLDLIRGEVECEWQPLELGM
jgi:hypothetical protein